MAETDDEQLYAVKQFFQRYGNAILTVLIVVLASYTAYQYWKNSQTAAHETASMYYNQITQLASLPIRTSAQDEQFNQLFAKLTGDYTESRYAAYAALLKAKMDVTANKIADAEKSLLWITKNNQESDILALTNLRLARIHVARAEYDKAQALLKDENNAFAPLYAELKGDIYLAQDKKELALTAYEKAKTALTALTGSDTRLLDMKIDMLKPAKQGTVLPIKVDTKAK